jgi:hypothetical protein
MNRVIAAVATIALAFPGGVIRDALAATGTVQGQVTVVGGRLPGGSLVKISPIGQGTPITATISKQATFKIVDLPEGVYRFEVVDRNGIKIGHESAIVTIVPARDLTLNITVHRGGSSLTRGQKMAIILGSIAAVAGGLCLAEEVICEDDDEVVSPSGP